MDWRSGAKLGHEPVNVLVGLPLGFGAREGMRCSCQFSCVMGKAVVAGLGCRFAENYAVT